jgi:IS5 family transposase
MRKIREPQMQLGAVDISEIRFDLRSRDEIPKLLQGLQYIYCTPELREEVFKILERIIPEGTDPNNGRRGMDLWKVLVLGTLRLNCNWDYDKLREIANNHRTLRLMLGHGVFDNRDYALQTLKDNVSLLTPEVLDQINQVAVKAGHQLVGKKKEEDLKGRCDSFVVETDVHYPTDINLLFDAITKVITLIAAVCFSVGISTWRQSNHNMRKIKKRFRKAQNLKRSSSENEKKKAERERLIKEAHQAYLELVTSFLERVERTITQLRDEALASEEQLLEIEKYLSHARRQIDQIRKRVVDGEKIPHQEKVFSIFEEHTEWICKGKAGVSQELGLRVCILEDQYGFILFHHVMEKQTDDRVAVYMVREAKERFSELGSCSFDKGFYSPDNRKELQEAMDFVILPKKGKLSLRDKEVEHSEAFVQGKKKHSAVESAINALENHGLDRCPDHGMEGFTRYAALAVLARNLQILGHMIQQKEAKRQKRLEKIWKNRKQARLRLAA